MEVADRYHWEAELPDGRVITKRIEAPGAVRVSLIPQVDGLPRRDITGHRVKRCFGRTICRMGGGMEYLHVIVCEGVRVYVKSSDGEVRYTPEDFEWYF